MTFALAAGARELRHMWEHKDGKFTRKDRPFANCIPPNDDEHGAPLPEAVDKFEPNRGSTVRSVKQ